MTSNLYSAHSIRSFYYHCILAKQLSDKVLCYVKEVKFKARMMYSKSQGRVSKVKKMLASLAITFPAKDPILFGSDLHFLPQRLTGTETYWSRLDVHCKIHLNVLSTNTGEVSVPQPIRGAAAHMLILSQQRHCVAFLSRPQNN